MISTLAVFLAASTLTCGVSDISRPKFQVTEDGLMIEGVDSTCPIIYDNDWWSDTPDKDYLWAKVSLGQADLRGNIVTRDLWNWQEGYLYTMKQGIDDARKSIGIARRSGLRNIPDPVAGADQAFLRPESGEIEDTIDSLLTTVRAALEVGDSTIKDLTRDWQGRLQLESYGPIYPESGGSVVGIQVEYSAPFIGKFGGPE